MNWLITGGCGFIGRNLVRVLVANREHSIRIVDNESAASREDLAAVTSHVERAANAIPTAFPTAGNVELINADVTHANIASAAVRGADVIVHLAANTGVGPSVENPRLDCEVNVLGTFNYLEAARANKTRRFVFASSGAPIGECVPPIHEELAAHPVSPYGASKLAGEGYCSAYFRTFGVDTVALRFGNVYGPFSSHKSSVVAKFIRDALAGENLEIYGDGQQTRDFIYVDDLIEAIVRASTIPNVGGEVFQIATSAETTVNELAALLSDLLVEAGCRKPPIVNSDPRLGDVMRNFSDTSKARDRLGWRANTSLKVGLAQTLDWFLARPLAPEPGR